MNRKFCLRALACVAVSVLTASSFAANYSVMEYEAKPAAKRGAYTSTYIGSLAADGRALISVATILHDSTVEWAGETCKATGSCKLLPPLGRDAYFRSASRDMKRIAGTARDEEGVTRAVRVNSGVLEYLEPVAWVNSINKKNVFTGSSAEGPAFRYGDSLELLPTLAMPYGEAFWINDDGVTVGYSYNAEFEERAVLWSKSGALRELQPTMPAGMGYRSVASYVSVGGVAYGTSNWHDRGAMSHAVRFAKGKAISLGTLGKAENDNTSQASRANSAGQVVGSSTNLPLDGESQAVLFTNGTAVELATLIPQEARDKYALRMAFDINDAGQILVLRLDPMP
jgi:uncharacterized membrane protein